MTTFTTPILDTNATQISYASEAVWTTPPATTFKALRYTSESMSATKTRARPGEINPSREVVQAVTTQVAAGGNIGFALSYGTFDDLLGGAVNQPFSAPVAIAGVAADIVLTNVSPTSATLTSATAGKFTAINQGNWIRLLGFVSNGGQNNQIYYVATKASALSLTLTSTAPTVTETPTGALAQVRQSNIRNGTVFTSFYFQQRYTSSLWLRYPGCYVSSMTLTGGVGQFLSGSMTLLAASEASAVVTADTGGITAAPAGSVFNPVGAFSGIYFNEVLIGVVNSFTLNINNPGAQLLWGMGSSSAQGLIQGQLEVTGTLKIYFQNFTLYANFIAETQGRLTIIARDSAGQAYAIQLVNAFLNNFKIDAGSVNSAVYATCEVEANPLSSTGVSTISIDALAAV